MLKVEATALHPFATAFTVMVPTSALALELVAVKLGIVAPFPDAAKPIVGVELPHEMVAVAGVTVMEVAGTVFPGQ